MREQAVKGLKWSILRQGINQAVNYSAIIYLAAKVAPELHGLITIAAIPGGFVGVIGSLGVREKLIREKELSADLQAAYFGFTLATALLIIPVTLLISAATAYAYAVEFGYSTMFGACLALALIPSVGLMNSYFEALRYRLLDFRMSSLITIISITAGSLLAVFLAAAGYGYWALIIKLIGPHICILFGWLFVSKRSFRIKWDAGLYRSFKDYSLYFTWNAIANYFVRNIDYLIIGKFFPANILGQYTIAYKILLFPMRNITTVIQNVMLPVLSRFTDAANKFRDNFFLIVSTIAFTVFPLMAFLSVSTNEWVPLIFNPAFTHIELMIIVLSIVGAFQAVTSPVWTLYILKERTKTMFGNTLLIAVLTGIVFLASSVYFSINWVVIDYALLWVAAIMPLTVIVAYRMYGYRFADFIRSVYPSVVAALSASAMFYYVRKYGEFSSSVCLLITGGLLFVFTYLVIYHALTRNSRISLIYFINILARKNS